jgi:hypothetical protein
MRWFWIALVAVALLALAWRVVYVTELDTGNPNYGDGFYYHTQANLIADGHGFANPWIWEFSGRDTYRPAAVHPPLYSAVLAVPSVFGGTTYLWHKLMSCLLGAGAVLVLGLVGRRIAGPRAGIIAALIAAFYPNFWSIDGLMLAEGLFALLIGLTILVAYRFRDRPSWPNAGLLGALVALAALTRGEAIFLSVFLILPLVLMTKSIDLRRRVGLIGVAALGVIVVMSPWVVRNLTTFEEPFLISSNSDAVLRVANCDATYSGYSFGYWSVRCGGGFPGLNVEESVDAKEDRRVALDYIGDHQRDLPRVVAARIGRAWDVFHPFQNAKLATVEGKSLTVARAGLIAYWMVLPFAIAGTVILVRRKVTVIPLMAQVVLVTFAAAMAYGAVRFRIPAEVALIALAGVALDAVLRLVFRKPTGEGDPVSPPAPIEDPVGASAP